MKTFFTMLLALVVFSGVAQQKDYRQEYINKYKGLVIESMEVYGIPASIKMAQALLESDNGRSRLAVEANNHFGIKCKKEWTGETITHDDDAKGECFRKYSSAEASFKDHSEFLDKSPRYQFLFDLDPKDYIEWAKGLKLAGYATNPKYAEILIGIIEEYKLYLLDTGDIDRYAFDKNKEEVAVDTTTTAAETETAQENLIDVDNFVVNIGDATTDGKPVKATSANRVVQHNNGVAYVVIKDGDTFDILAKELRMSKKKLLKYNDLKSEVKLHKGAALYIKAKKKSATNGKYAHNFKEGDSMHNLSQRYGIQLKALYKINFMPDGYKPSVGQVIRLK